MSDLERALGAADLELGNAARALGTSTLEELLDALPLVKALRTSVSTVGVDLEHAAGCAMPDKSVVVNGVEWVRSKPPKRGEWDHEALRRAVDDSRRFDPESGELVEETPVQKIEHVWNLAGYSARLGALRERGINPDDFSKPSWDSALYKVAKAADKKGRKK